MSQVKKHTYPPINMGISLLLVTFLVLSMVVFAVLSVSGALKDYHYSQETAERTAAYYEACNKAVEILEDFSFESSEDVRAEFLIPVGDSQGLQVVLERSADFASDNESESDYKIVTWKWISTKDWIGSSTLPVLGSD